MKNIQDDGEASPPGSAMSGETLRNRLHSATCDCGARDGDCAVGNDGIAVVAEWLRAKAAETRAVADLLPLTDETEARGAAKMLTALADSLGASE